MAIGRLSFLTIDANDPERLSSFWSAMLDVEVEERMDGGRFVFLAASNDIVISFQRVPEPKAGKNRVHLDVRVEDLDEATGGIRGLGGSWDGNEFTLDEARWRTLTDPEGNEFDIYVSGA
jgi:predicted enzyme related to lactoylglutathione lyase